MSRALAMFFAFLLAVSLANADGVSAPGAPHSIGSQGFEIKYPPGGGSAPAAPVNSVAPVVSGSTVNGSLLSTTTGTWSGSPSFSYQWQRNGSPISGAAAPTYTTQPADGGTLVGVQVTATNGGGSVSALSSNTIAILPPPPANSVAPVASGSLTIGSLLSTTNGTWSNSPTFTYQWQRAGSPISGATASTYTTASADGGTAVGAQVTGTNAGGSASALSNTLAITSGATTMATPIFATLTTVPSNTATNYAPFGSSQSWNATLTAREIPIPSDGVLSGLQVFSLTSIIANYFQIKIYVNAVATGIVCTFGQSPGGTNYGSTTACADTTDTVAVHPGDLVSVESSVPGGTTTAEGASPRIVLLFTSTNPQESPIVLALALGSATAVSYIGPSTGPNFVTTDLAASWVMPEGGTLKNLWARINVAAGSTAGWLFTVFKNGVATGIIAGDATHCGGASSLACSDLVDTISVVAGDTVSIKLCPSSASGLGANCPANGSAPAAATQSVSLLLVPALSNQAILISNTAPTTNPNYFIPIHGGFAGSSSENIPQQVPPSLGSTMTMGNLITTYCPGPDSTGAGGVTRTTTLRAGGVSKSPHVSNVGSAINSCPTMTTAQDTVDTFSVPVGAGAGSVLDFFVALNTSTNATAPTTWKSGMTVSLP